MYDYRNDLLNIINNIDDTDEGLIHGRELLRSAMHLIDALPSDGNHTARHPFTIKHNHHQHNAASSTDHLAPASDNKAGVQPQVNHPLNGNQYETLNKLKGLLQELKNLTNNSDDNAANKLAQRYHKITATLSEQDKHILADQLQPIHHHLDRLGVVHDRQSPEKPHHKRFTPSNNNGHHDLPQATFKSSSPETATTDHPKTPFSSQKRQYIAQRELNGATLLTENGQDAGHVSESIVRKMNLTSGTVVKADIMPNNIFIHKVLRHIDHLGSTKFDDKTRIATFEFGVVKKHKHHLRVTYNSNNEPLLVNGKKYAFLLDLDNPVVGNGSIVELAWYKDDPDSMRIRWTYPTEKPLDEAKVDNSKHHNKDDETSNSEPSITKRYPDLDLNGKTVAVLVGNRQEHEDYERQIELYHGQPTIVDSFKTKKSYLKDKLKSADIVILVKSKAHHGASKAVAEFQDQFGFAFAVANTLAMGQFEDALYRASHGMPADITSMTNLH